MDEDSFISSNENNPEIILSVCYGHERISCSFYNLETMELYVTYEAPDQFPRFSYLHNIFRRIKPDYVLATGSADLYKEILKLLNYPIETEFNQFRAINKYSNGNSNYLIYQYNSKTLNTNRRRILLLTLPGMNRNLTESERSIFLKSILPLHQELVIHSLGNLLNYLDTNWQHLFIRENDQNLNENLLNTFGTIVTDIKIFYLQSQVLIDDGTINSLQIFSDIRHPSSLKKNSVKEGYSLFQLLDRCASKIGSRMLRNLLSQPIRDVNELELRYSTVEWLIEQRKQSNSIIFTKLHKYLRNINDVSKSFRNMQLKRNCPNDWIFYKRCVYSAYVIMNYCLQLSPDIQIKTLIQEIGNALPDLKILSNTLFTIDRVVDLEQFQLKNYFIVKIGLDETLDEKRNKMIDIQNNVELAMREECQFIPSFISEIEGCYIPEIGYVIKVKSFIDDPPLHEFETESIKYLAQNHDEYYFKTTMCSLMNERYGKIYIDIRLNEQQICERLLEYLSSTLPSVQKVVKLCGKLDYLMAFAIISIEKNLIKPILTNDRCIHIENGRHILMESFSKFIPTNTNINDNLNNIITILTAPNESGKSVYMKQIAIILYLGHIGCFIPATYGKFLLLDSIYSKLHVTDSTYNNCSAFLIDLQQISKIMAFSRENSLVLIDEFGTGTTVLDGKALLISLIEELASRLTKCPITLIATHYNDIYDYLKNENITWQTFANKSASDGSMIATYKIINGPNKFKRYAHNVFAVKYILDKIFKLSTTDKFIDNVHQKSVQTIHNFKRDIGLYLLKICKYLTPTNTDSNTTDSSI